MEKVLLKLRLKIKNRAKKFVEWFPPDFFAKNWGFKSINTGPGRVALQDALQNFLQKKGKYQFDKSSLVSGKTQ